MPWQRVNSFLVVLLLILPATMFSQQQMPRNAQKSPHVLQQRDFFSGSLRIHQPLSSSAAIPAFFREAPFKTEGIAVPAAHYYSSCLGFFCRKEWQFEKTTLVPLRFRLGSLDYVNKMEGKK
jgi:hypothetical protein